MIRLAFLLSLLPSVAVAASVTTPALLQGTAVVVWVEGVPAGSTVGLVGSGSLAGRRFCPAALAPTCLDLRGRAVLIGVERAQPSWTLFHVTVPVGGPTTVQLQGAWLEGGVWRTTDVATLPVLAPAGDEDGDGLSNQTELVNLRSDPLDADTDGDGLDDGEEQLRLGTSPTRADSDLDGLSDYQESQTFGTSPLRDDTDGDTVDDRSELALFHTSPTDADSDHGGASDGVELFVRGTDPLDGADDGVVAAPDADGDGLVDAEEAAWGADPNRPDTDGDGLRDGAEVHAFHTSPVLADTDGGGVDDRAELLTQRTDPTFAADDQDPSLADADRDGLTDVEEVLTYGTQPFTADTDGGGLPDGLEVALGLDPHDPTDG